jgi:small redox-active disulfide protein 2
MKIQILGTGCAKCDALTMATEKAAQSLGLQYELEKVTDLKQIMSFGVMTTPALVVNGQVKVSREGISVPEISPLPRCGSGREVYGKCAANSSGQWQR